MLIFLGRFLQRITPKHTEVSLFLFSLALILLFIGDHEILEDTINAIHDGNIIFLVIVVVGTCVSIYYAFSRKAKSKDVKDFLLLYAITVNFIIAVFTFNHIADKALWYEIPAVGFALWNVGTSALLILAIRAREFHIIDSSGYIFDNDARAHELVIGGMTTAIIVSGLIFVQFHWTIVLSMVLVYASSFNDSVTKWLYGFYNTS